MTLKRAYILSLGIHAVLVLFFWLVDVNVHFFNEKAAQQEAARSHEASYQRTASATYADRLKRMSELIERIDREEREKETAAAQKQAGLPSDKPTLAKTVHATTSPAEKQSQEVADLWRESSEHYDALRERYLEERAKTLAEITGTDLQTALKKVQADTKDFLKVQQDAPADKAEGAAQIAKMEADGRRMLNVVLQNSRRKEKGQTLDLESSRDAYLLGQNVAGSPETRRFDEVVDYTPLMISRGPSVNGKLDTPEDLRRIEKMRSPALQNHFYQTRHKIQFTRRIGGDGAKAASWIAPDSWYIIGPFPNPWRSQIDTSFPPEMEIDRDAVYDVGNGRTVSWQYTRTQTLGVIPPKMVDHAVYYAYTEIHCAAPIDCWLAIGSDDYSKVWVNDLLVWSGAKDEKIWRPTEGFRRVHLDQGVNRFLLRLENGINGCEFSLLISLD